MLQPSSNDGRLQQLNPISKKKQIMEVLIDRDRHERSIKNRISKTYSLENPHFSKPRKRTEF